MSCRDEQKGYACNRGTRLDPNEWLGQTHTLSKDSYTPYIVLMHMVCGRISATAPIFRTGQFDPEFCTLSNIRVGINKKAS